MQKFFVIEARRLLPLVFLLALLVSLSVYDNFFRLQPVDVPPKDMDQSLYVTATRGHIATPASFLLVDTQEKWAQLKDSPVLNLPEYPFNASFEVALCSVNSEINDIKTESKADGTIQVQVRVKSRPHYYHVVTISREKIDSPVVHWIISDEQGQVLLEETFKREQNGTKDEKNGKAS